MGAYPGHYGITLYYRTTYKHPSNQSVTNLLVKELKANNPTYSADDIRGNNAIEYLTYLVYIHFPYILYYIAACYTYYKSVCQEALKRNGARDF